MTETTGPEAAASYEEATDRTLYWTLSLYIDAERLYGDGKPLGPKHDVDAIRQTQRADPVSRALRDAIEPLFNDIADREWLGNVQDFLLAARPAGGEGMPPAMQARGYEDLTIQLPTSVRWKTEGVGFVASPAGLDKPRTLSLRRFWFAHNDGALSYHLAFTAHYEHTPTDYFYLSLLQKLCAPKEFSLSETWQDADGRPDPITSGDLGVAPLDEITVIGPDGREQRFWELVAEYFRADASALLEKLARQYKITPDGIDPLKLIEMVPLLEAPGLLMPKCRTLFFFQDERFFKRLMPPINPKTDSRYPRSAMVREECYAPYGAKMKEMKKKAASKGADVLLDDSYWHWVRDGVNAAGAATSETVQGGAVRKDSKKEHAPESESQRAECLDYLFLAGFNQNIIDFMNQDTSEILDSIDPIFPRTEEQQDEGFFVRFANHRSMITYARSSRSLEVGNDYIGTCPYAFLIHALSFHNEFLARSYEHRTAAGIEKIQTRTIKSDLKPHDYREIEQAINRLKIGRYRDFERHRHVNVFRYDTERDVFEELERLRGTERKQQALSVALASLEDHATDLEVRQQREEGVRRREEDDRRRTADEARRVESERSAARERRLNQIFLVVGLLTAVQFLGDLANFLKEPPPAFLSFVSPHWAWSREVPFVIHLAAKALGVGVTIWAIAMAARFFFAARGTTDPAQKTPPQSG